MEPASGRPKRKAQPPDRFQPSAKLRDKSTEAQAARRQGMAETRKAMGDAAAAAMAQFDMYEFETGLGDKLARLYEGPGFSTEERQKLLPLVQELVPPAGDERWEAKHHMHFNFDRLLEGNRQKWGRPLLLAAFSKLKGLGLLHPFTITSAELVVRYGAFNPDHFDKATGALAYQQAQLPTTDGKGMASGLRLLLDLGELPYGTDRPLTFKLQQRRSTNPRLYQPTEAAVSKAQKVHSTLAGAVFMDGLMAGSGGMGGVLHGRYGSETAIGATLSLDLAVARWGRVPGERGLALDSSSQRVAEFFSDTKPKNHSQPQQSSGALRGRGRWGTGTAADNAAERTAAAASQLGVALPPGGAPATAPTAADQLHCFWCHTLRPGSGETCEWLRAGSVNRRVCVACGGGLNRNVMGSERPAAVLCPGCPGCT